MVTKMWIVLLIIINVSQCYSKAHEKSDREFCLTTCMHGFNRCDGKIRDPKSTFKALYMQKMKCLKKERRCRSKCGPIKVPLPEMDKRVKQFGIRLHKKFLSLEQ